MNTAIGLYFMNTMISKGQVFSNQNSIWWEKQVWPKNYKYDDKCFLKYKSRIVLKYKHISYMNNILWVIFLKQLDTNVCSFGSLSIRGI